MPPGRPTQDQRLPRDLQRKRRRVINLMFQIGRVASQAEIEGQDDLAHLLRDHIANLDRFQRELRGQP